MNSPESLELVGKRTPPASAGIGRSRWGRARSDTHQHRVYDPYTDRQDKQGGDELDEPVNHEPKIRDISLNVFCWKLGELLRHRLVVIEVLRPRAREYAPVVGRVRLPDALVVGLVPVRPEVVPVLLGDGPDPGSHRLTADRGQEVPRCLGDDEAPRRVPIPGDPDEPRQRVLVELGRLVVGDELPHIVEGVRHERPELSGI